MFNWLTVLILLPIEAATGYLYRLTTHMVLDLSDVRDTGKPQFFKTITDPVTNKIVQVRIRTSSLSYLSLCIRHIALGYCAMSAREINPITYLL